MGLGSIDTLKVRDNYRSPGHAKMTGPKLRTKFRRAKLTLSGAPSVNAARASLCREHAGKYFRKRTPTYMDDRRLGVAA